jgi:hypothetical protein
VQPFAVKSLNSCFLLEKLCKGYGAFCMITLWLSESPASPSRASECLQSVVCEKFVASHHSDRVQHDLVSNPLEIESHLGDGLIDRLASFASLLLVFCLAV